MKTILAAAFRLIICGIETLGLGIFIPIPGTDTIGLVTAVQTQDCLGVLVVQVSANPSNIAYGQSSLVSWSVSLPPECGYTSVQLNGQPVAPGGNQTVTPTQSTTYKVTVFLNLDGASIEKSASVRVTVTSASTNLFCPVASLSRIVEFWETDPKDQWLTEVLNVANLTILFGPNLSLTFNDASEEELPPPLDPRVPLMSTCAFIPGIPDSLLDDQIPERSDPATTVPTTSP